MTTLTKFKYPFKYNRLTKTFLVFYFVGLLLFILPLTRTLFLFITPLSLIFVTAAVLYHHKPYNTAFIAISASIVVLSFILEVIGVQTGLIFGQYEYLSSLGLKFMDTPLIIGVNWLMLTYCSAALVDTAHTKIKIKPNFFSDVIAGAVIMLIYDLILEQVAPVINMWIFRQGEAPVTNYTTWFIAAFVFHFAYRMAGIKFKNRPAANLFMIQILFFAIIFIYSYLISQ